MKSQMGMEKTRFKSFKNVYAHVCWTYVAYLLLKLRSPQVGLSQAKLNLKNDIAIGKISKYRRTLNLFGGRDQLESLCLAETRQMEASKR